MKKVGDSYFQTSVLQGTPPKEHTERIDIVVGSGRRGQTFLYWKGDEIFELPVTYWTALKGWINSPGYPDDTPRFDKPIVPRCLECHGTYFQAVSGRLNAYKPDSVVLGISCETCHGPGKQHIAAVKERSSDLQTLSLHSLSREKQMDVCALCHAGAGTEVAPALSFKPGKELSNFITVDANFTNGSVDVHGNQVEAIEVSQCWQSARKLTCTTCHDVHKPQREPESYSRVCLGCHTAQACGAFHKAGATAGDHCIACHMPIQQSQTLVSITRGKEIKPSIRSHQIRISPQSEMEQRGDGALASGQLKEAIAAFEQAVDSDPGKAMLEFKLAMARDKAGDIAGEKSALEKAMAINPDMAIAKNQMGYLAVRGGDFPSAEEDFRKAVYSSPAYTQAWINLATVLAMQSKMSDAQGAIANALKVDPQNPDALQLQQDLTQHH